MTAKSFLLIEFGESLLTGRKKNKGGGLARRRRVELPHNGSRRQLDAGKSALSEIQIPRSVVYALGSVSVLLFQIGLPQAHAQQAKTSLDLSSANRTITAGENHSGTITVGGASVTVTPGMLLTPAESVALSQVLGGGTQGLVLDASGIATGGQFSLTGNNHSNVVIPQGVTAVRNFASAGGLNLSGNLTNLGSFYAVSNNNQVLNAIVSAQNINNMQSGLLTTVLPQGGLDGFSNLIGNLSLSLNAIQHIVNYGTITSAANLNLSAGGSVINALPQGVTGPSPVMQAMSNLNIVASAVQNAGLISSLQANINVASQLAQNLTINNVGGVMQALNGNIEIRDPLLTDKVNTTLLGGDWNSHQLNVFSGDGHINVDVHQISGQVNLVGGTAALAAEAGDLHVGALKMTGDPTISSGGDVFLEMSQFGGQWLFPGIDALIINAGGDIINKDVSHIGTTGKSGGTGSVIMNAGGLIDLQTVPIISISTASTGGASSGGISLTANGPILLSGSLSTHAAGGGQSGDVSINSVGGEINTNGNFAIDSSASGGGNAGAVSLNAASGITCQNGININSSSDNGNAGSILVVSQFGDVNLSGAAGSTLVNASSIAGMAGQFNVQALGGGFLVGDGSFNLSSKTGQGGSMSLFASGGAITFGKSAVDVSGLYGGSVSALTTWGIADIDMANVDIKANGDTGGYSGSVSFSAGLFGPDMVISDKVSVGNVEVTGGDGSFSSIVFGTQKSDVEVGSINTNGASVVAASAANLSIDSIVSNNAGGSGGSISLSSYVNALPTDSTQALGINSGSGSNSVGSISVNGANGGSIFANNKGTGGINAGSILINATSGTGGNIVLSADGDVHLTGAVYSVNGGSAGDGGQITLSSANGKVTGGDLAFSAVGGANNGGGTLSVFGQTIQFGNVVSDTSGNGKGSSGIVAIGGSSSTVIADTMNITNDGGGVTSVQMVGSLQVNDLTVNARGGDLTGQIGGTINLVFTDGVHGNLHLDTTGAEQGNGGTIELRSYTDLNLQAGKVDVASRGGSKAGNGGLVVLFSNGATSLDASVINVSAASGNGNGGCLEINTGLDSKSASGSLTVNGTINVDGAGNGNGGMVDINVRNTNTSVGNLTVGNGSGFNISARSGTSSGNGGSVTITTGGDLFVTGSGLAVNAQGSSGNGGVINLTAGGSEAGKLGSTSHKLTLDGNFNAGGNGSGAGGKVTMLAHQVTVGDGTTISAAASGSGNGGSISLTASGLDSDLMLGTGSKLNAGSATGNGGSVNLVAARNLNLSGASVDTSSGALNGGQIALNAGSTQAGVLSLDGDLLSNGGGSGNGGSITLNQNSAAAMLIGASQGGKSGSGVLSTASAGGGGGSLTLNSGAGNDLTVQINQTVNLGGSSLSKLGSVNASSSGNVTVSGPGTLSGSFNGSAKVYSVSIDGAGSSLGVGNVSSSSGNASIKATAANSSLAFAAGANLQASKGSVEIGAASMHFLGDATLSMDNAGLLKVNSGSQSNSLSMDFADGSTVTFNVDQGAAIRPGVVQIGPNGTGSLSMNSGGAATLEFTGGTVSMTSASGAITLGSGLTVNSDAFDTTSNLGVEVIASDGDINLSSAVTSRQLNLSTIGSGSINLAADINSPTVVMSVEGKGSINQTGTGSIGIGTLILSSQSGNIGSASNPIEANVLEMKASSGGSVYVNNASQMDLRTSTVAGTFNLNSDGDLAIESNVSAGTLNLTANGNITIFSGTSGTNGVSLASSSGGNIQVGTGFQLSSSAGSVNLLTDNLILDGSILVQAAGAQVSLNSISGSLALSGSSGAITASGANSLISMNGSNSVSFNSSYILNAGSSGTAQVQTSSLSSGGVSLGANVSLTAAGGSQLNIFSNSLSFASGSSISGSHASNALSVQSSLGAPLTVSVAGASTANVNATAGGSVHFAAGTGAPLTFQSSSLSTANLSVNGGKLVTTSSAADTSLNNINLSSNKNIEVNVNGGTLNLNGNITSSQNGGVIVLQDPAGITIAGNGTVGFSSGLSGTINVLAMNAGDTITFAGNTQFNAGSSGTVNFNSAASINFGAGSTTTINGGATLNVSSPIVSFANGSQLSASGASKINFSGLGAAGLSMLLPNGSSTVSTNGGAAITVSAQSGAPINFSQSTVSASTSTLNFLGAPLTISTSNANVTIDANVVVHSDNTVSVLTPGGTLVNNGLIDNPNPGSQTIIEAAGNLLINQNVNANSLIIRTTANNGTITLAANVNVVNDLLVSAIGSGRIKQTAGILSAASITLMSGSGDIGSDNDRIKTVTSNLSVSTKGAAFIKNTGAVQISSYSVGEGLDLKATGNITLGSASTKTLSITSNGTFNAGSKGTVSIMASDSISVGAGVRVRVNESALNVSTASLSMGNNSRLRSDGNLNITANVSGQDYRFVSREGNLQISGNLSGTNVILRTKDDGNITLNGNANTHSLLIDANGKGNISSSGTLTSDCLVLLSDKGSIGTSSKSLSTSVGELTVRTSGNGSVNISNKSGNLDLHNSHSGSAFTLKTSGSLNVNDVETHDGSINLQSGGVLRVEKGSTLKANEGNLTLQNNDTASGTISIGKNVNLIALSASSSSGLGNVNVVIGAVPSSPTKGSKPANMDVNTKWGGQAFFGANGITVNGKNNELNAFGANVIFNTGSRSKSAIVIDGGLYVLADPPPASAGITSSQAVSAAPVTQSFTVNIPSITGPSFVFGQALDGGSLLNSAKLAKAEISKESSKSGQASDAVASSDAGDELRPIACVTPVATVQQGRVEFDAVSKGIVRKEISNASIYTKACHHEVESSALKFKSGEMMVCAHKFTQIKAGNADVSLSGNTIALLKNDGHNFEVYNLYEDRWGAMKVLVNGREFVLGAGQRLLIGQNGCTAVRNEKVEKASSSSVKTGEFPLLSLISNSNLMLELMHSNIKEDRRLGARLFKMAACLQVVTGSHGQFKN